MARSPGNTSFGNLMLVTDVWEIAGLLIASAVLAAFFWFSERKTRAQRAVLRRLNRLGEEVLVARSGGEIVERASSVLPKALGITAVRLYLYQRGTRSLNSVPVSASPESVSVPLDSPLGLTQIGAVTCFRNRTLLAIPDTRHNPFSSELGGQGPRSLFFVPMFAQSELVGVVEIADHSRYRDLKEEEKALAQHLANQMGVAIKLLEQQNMREQLSRSEKLAAIGQLISGVVNDLQAPLKAVSGLAEMALRDSGATRESELRAIAAEARKAGELVSRLVSFGKPEEIATRRIDLNRLLRSLVELRSREQKARGAQMHNLLRDRPIYVLGSESLLQQVFLNLIVEAEQSLADATEKVMRLEANVLANHCLVEIGFRGEILKESETLQVCRSVLAGHSGELRVHSARGESLLQIELPCALPEATDAGPMRAGQPKPAVQLTVLLIEPDSSAARQLLMLLSARGHRVVPVHSSEEGIDLIQRLRFDVVICSVHLAGLSWPELFRRVREKIGAFVLLVEGYKPEWAANLAGEGSYVLAKPIDEERLESMLSAIQDQRLSAASLNLEC